MSASHADHRLNGDGHTGLKDYTVTTTTVVADLGIFVHVATDAVSDELADNAVAGFLAIVLDGKADVAQAMSRHSLLYTDVQSLLGGLQQAHHLLANLAHGERIGAVGVETVEFDAAVDGDDITVTEHGFLRRYAMYDLLVDRGAEGARKILIALASGDTAVVAYILFGDAV